MCSFFFISIAKVLVWDMVSAENQMTSLIEKILLFKETLCSRIRLSYSSCSDGNSFFWYSPWRALKPCSGTLDDPVTNCRSRARRSSSNDSTAFQNHFTMLLSGVQCLSRVLDFQSFMSILPKPHTISCMLRRQREGHAAFVYRVNGSKS